ncbi:Glycerophosphoryl diester phosphodiesterase [Mariprofundus aestuarium]|uniref:Glycerophosphoryl diester phosphodiesterase n=1 Tax=Mariprofundus aestuarium TaxID=1921086 RepID=A0A2K8KYW4_MARES|nr:glycerophosphodiester phosphodiesterase family protein [Mariprofundus aestuarium]ATX80210.1 Glycerophosphoryl diester phosphodiesterase [Mariprofundus aestuarium]
MTPSLFLVAHRGDHEHEIENTLAAFDAAAKAGALYIECDIQFTKDFMPVIVHDSRLETGRVSELARNELPPHIPTFDAVLKWLEHSPAITLFIEIKLPVLQRRSARSVARTLHTMIPEPLLKRIVPISMSAKLVEVCSREFNGSAGWVMESGRSPEGPFTYLFFPWQNSDQARQWHHRGVKTVAYTVNSPEQASALHAGGIDLIETNHFSRLQRALQKSGSTPK